MSAAKIIAKIEDWSRKKVVNITPLAGGCINNANKISLETGQSFFMKYGGKQPGLYSKEANGLVELKKANCIRVPEVCLVDDDFLLLEYIQSGAQTPDFFYRFGRQLAQLHQYCAKNFGFYEDNYIGATPQLNRPNELEAGNWFDFYYNKRLLYQYKLAERKGLVGDELKNGFMMLDTRIEEMMEGSEEAPSLLHGDLWSGNFMVDEHSNPCLIDPAVYYGHREAELAMTKLFGGFNEAFYSAYRSSFPLPDGYDHRENIYLLYHVLNHLNLFGNTYYGQAVRLVWSYL